MLMYDGPDTSVMTETPWLEHREALQAEQLVYLDHATTSHPRAPGVLPAITQILASPHGSPGRAARSTCVSPDRIVDGVRAPVASFFGMPAPRRVIFTSGSTYALNLALKGFLAPGDHVIATCFEHNAVLRPLMQLQRAGCKVTIVRRPIPDRGLVDAVVREFRPETRLVVVNHASNVCGTILPVEDIGAAARAQGIRVLVDASQTAGHVPIDLGELPADMLAFSAHKGPLGPPGVGCLLVADESIELTPLVMGGTGLQSEELCPPCVYPQSYEVGTQNLPGIAGLGAALRFLAPQVMHELSENAERLHAECFARLSAMPHVEVYGHAGLPHVPILAFNVAGYLPETVGALLERDHGILVRTGFHCAPLAHEALGSGSYGAVRVSLGYRNTTQCIDRLCEALGNLKQ